MSSEINTPMMVQFNAIKEKYPDSILFFRMGDFYEMFGEDAKTASKLLGIALTTRNKHAESAVPMCGVPYYKYQLYATRLVNAGLKVAICDQLEDPVLAKGIVKRGVTRVITRATMIDSEEISAPENNFIMACYIEEKAVFNAFADISTGEIYLLGATVDGIKSAIAQYEPKEALSNLPLSDIDVIIRKPVSIKQAVQVATARYNVKDNLQLGISEPKFFIPLEMIFSYVEEKLLKINFARPAFLTATDELVLDNIARKTLEITQASEGGTSLYSVINHTVTAIGARMLQKWLRNPSRDINLINRRLDQVEFFLKEHQTASAIERLLRDVHDIERILSRIFSERAMPRDLIYLKNSLRELPHMAHILEECSLEGLTDGFAETKEVFLLIENTLMDEPASSLMEGGIIRSGVYKDVDELRDIKDNSTALLAAKETELKEKTGINQLKIAYNKVFGFYIEISKSYKGEVPKYFERKQTLAGSERYTIVEIKELENAIFNAEDNLFQLEYTLFCDLRKKIAVYIEILRKAAVTVGELDCLLSLAKTALTKGYVRPSLAFDGVIELVEARHPMVEAASKEIYIANDFYADNFDRLKIVTGPNMAGKSTYIRSVALCVILAHVGSFVPAKSAKIALTDRVFTRVGASDNIAYGHSTFMVEMVETANILTHATKESLIILDEIGRGTSTYDGVSIAWAVAEYILNKIRAKTLFATHYHELIDMEGTMMGVKNLSVIVKEENGEVIFLHKIKEGASDKSYGIYVAELAGLPAQVIKSAKSTLTGLERAKPRKHKQSAEQVLVFDKEHPTLGKIKLMDPNNLTPMQALEFIFELKKMTT